MKKILSFLMVLILVFCVSVPAFSAAPQAQTNDEPFQFRRLIVDERDADGNLHKPYWVDEDGNEVTVPMPEGHVAAAADNFPASYDLRDFGYVTPVKNQAQVGSCWAFSTIACMESSMLRQGHGTASDTDYSEAHLAWFSQRQRTPDTSDPTHGDGYDAENPFDDGSNLFFSTATLMRGSGVQLESNAPWTNPQSPEDAMRDMAQPESDRYVSHGRLYEARWLYDFTINDVKQALLQNGNVSMAYLHVPYGWNDAHNCYYQNLTDVYVNHGVEIVGWDDNFSKDNFNEGMRPQEDGAWLVKGSWGAEYGDDGYYWLSYRDPSISQIFTLVAKPADIYDNIYQYDGTLALASCTSLYGHIQAANRFRSTKTEQLTHVAFWSENYWGVDATVRVYIANEDYVPDGSDPTANMTLVDAATTVLRDVQCGYYTVELKQPVNVSGRYFTVVVSFVDDLPYHSPWTGATITLEGSGESVTGLDFDLSYSGKAGQSFIRSGNAWADCKEYGNGGFNNVPIKAMTSGKTSASGFSLTYNANGGSGAPSVQKGVGAMTISNVRPMRAGYTFLGWAENALSKQAQYAPGASFTLTKNVMLYAVWQVDPTAPKTKVSIRNFVPSRTERFFTTVEFFAETENIPGDAHIDWYVNGEKALSDADHFAYYGAKRDYTVQVKMVQGNRVLAQSDVETVHIPRGFSDILRSLFRLLFARPYYVQQ